MAANMLPILAIAGAFLLLGRKKDSNGSGTDSDAVTDDVGGATVEPEWDKPTPRGDIMVSVGTGIQLRMGTGGNISQMTIDGPEGSSIADDVTIEGGSGEERVALTFNTPGVWHVTLIGTAGDTGAHLERSWMIESLAVQASKIHKKCPQGKIWTCVTLGGKEQCWCQARLADINLVEKKD